MNLSTFLEASSIHGVNTLPLESKIKILFRQAAVAKANAYLKNSGVISRYKRVLKADDLLGGTYDSHVYNLIKVLLKELTTSLESLDNVRHASWSKQRGLNGLTLHIGFETNELANYFAQLVSGRRANDLIHGVPLVWYGTNAARVNFTYSGSEFFHYVGSDFFTFEDLHQAFMMLTIDAAAVTRENLVGAAIEDPLE